MGSKVVGFYALYESNLAAIFVEPDLQGKGIGKQLLNHAKSQRVMLILSVYKENQASYKFYLSQGFKVVSEQLDDHTGHLDGHITNASRGTASEWHFYYALVFVIKVLYGKLVVALSAP